MVDLISEGLTKMIITTGHFNNALWKKGKDLPLCFVFFMTLYVWMSEKWNIDKKYVNFSQVSVLFKVLLALYLTKTNYIHIFV